MRQTRLYFQSTGVLARRAYQLLENVFEDEEDIALAIIEIDESLDLHEVSIYTAASPDLVKTRMKLALAEISDLPKIEQELLPDIDWVTHSLQGLHAVRAGRFYIHGAHERAGKLPGETGIEIEAGLAFGTGHHGTTAGCLRLISDVLKAERPVNALDLGSGSAVLAIAIAKLARIPVLATDIDPVAVEVARRNVHLNAAKAWVTTVTAPGFHHPVFAQWKPFDLIVANILARPLMKLAPAMASHLSHGGSLILSGILEHQRRSVIAAYVGQGFRHVTTFNQDGWVTILMKR